MFTNIAVLPLTEPNQAFPDILTKQPQTDIMNFLQPQALTILYSFKFKIYNIGLL